MKYQAQINSVKILLLSFSLITTGFAAPLHEECDGKKKTCCLAQEMGNVPPMWVNEESCPKGMTDDATCPLQYGCTAVDEAGPKS